jgi:hypothetical protein
MDIVSNLSFALMKPTSQTTIIILPTQHLKIINLLLSSKNMAIVGDGNLVRLERLLDWVASFKNLVELLKSASLGLWKEEVHDGSLDGIPDDEDDVGLPAVACVSNASP